MRVVLTREAGRNSALVDWLPPGATYTEVPLTRTRYLERHEVRATIEASDWKGQFRSLVVTSERSQSYAAIAVGLSAPDVEVFSVGATTSAALERQGITVQHQGDGGALSLAPHVRHGPVLALGARAMREDLARALRDDGLEVEVVACYETQAVVPSDEDRVRLAQADVVFIGAPSAWEVARPFVARDAWIVVPGATTGAVVASEHERVLEGWGPSVRERLAVVDEPGGQESLWQ